jgi:hypothetical protein
MRLLWPRILYWLSFVFLSICLFYVITGITDKPGLDAKTTAQTGAGVLAIFGLIGMMLGKVWMDSVVRKRGYLPCPACSKRNHYTEMYCGHCGTQLRTGGSPATTSQTFGGMENSFVATSTAESPSGRRLPVLLPLLAFAGVAALALVLAFAPGLTNEARDALRVGTRSPSAGLADGKTGVAAVAPTPTVDPSTALFVDDFREPSTGKLPKASTDPRFDLGYDNGEYLIKRLDPSYSRVSGFLVPGEFADAVFRANVHLTDTPEGRFIQTMCRWQSPGGYYALDVRTDTGSFVLYRYSTSDNHFTYLADWQRSPAVHLGTEANDLELSCIGDVIAATINGIRVASGRDSTLSRGRLWLGLGLFADWLPAPGELRVAKLGVYRPPSEPGGARPAVSPTRSSGGDVLFADDATSSATGKLPRSTPDPRWTVEYRGGEYVLAKVDAAYEGLPSVPILGDFADATLRVDARLVGETTGREVILTCRDQHSSHPSQYRLDVRTDDGSFVLARWDDGKETFLAGWQKSGEIHRDEEANHLELSCVGDTISAKINGALVGSARDTTYQKGQMKIGTGVLATSLPGTAEVHFKNLVVTRPPSA